jgi:tripartite-type tricarboxylate transporter receptor subunit TctC
MNISRRRIASALALLPAASAIPRAASAQPASWPTRPVKIMVPYAPGGGPDVLTRRLAEAMSRQLGQNVLVENKVGAGGIIAAEVAARAAPDGYTLLLGASTHVTQKLIQPAVKFDPLRSFVHATRISTSPSVLTVDANASWRTASELADAIRKAPGRFNYASGGIGSAAHLSAAAFCVQLGLEAVHVPYKGSVEIVPAIISGDVQFGFPVSSTVLPLLEAGKVRALAVSSGQPMTSLPSVPTLREATGDQDLVLDAWSGIWLPAGAGPELVARVAAAVQQALADPDVRAFYDKSGSPVSLTATPAEFTHFIEAQTAKYAKIVAAAEIKL